MINNYDIFINDKHKNCWSCPNVILRFPSDVPLVLLWSSYGALKWVRSAFLDEPSGRSTSGRLFPKGLKKAERKEGSKVMRRYAPLMIINSLVHETGFVASRRYVREAINIGSIFSNNKSYYLLGNNIC